MGEVNYVLRVKILKDWSKRLLDLSQETYLKRILEQFHMYNCKPIDTPVIKGESLSLEKYPKTLQEKEKMNRVPYASAIGSLMYAMMCTRHFLCYGSGQLLSIKSWNQVLESGQKGIPLP